MTRRLFGTDGIRGTANSEPMTPETALKVAMAVGECFRNGTHKHLVVIGKDTRLSGYMLEPALTAGFITMGMDVVLVGPLPTPAIAMLTRSLRADIGVVISASHNPYADNGIKLFGRDGYKLSDELEAKIEASLEKGPSHRAGPGLEQPAVEGEAAVVRVVEKWQEPLYAGAIVQLALDPIEPHRVALAGQYVELRGAVCEHQLAAL